MKKVAGTDRLGTAERLLTEALENWSTDAIRAKASVEVALAELRLEKSKRFAAAGSKYDGLQVRIEMLRRGVSPHSWAQGHGFDSSTVWRTLRRGGPARKASARITEQLARDFGL